MEINFDSALKNFEKQLLEALRDNNKKLAIKIYGNLCIFEFRALSSENPRIRGMAYKAQSIKNEAFDFLML